MSMVRFASKLLTSRKNDGLESERGKAGSKQSDPKKEAIAVCYDRQERIDLATSQPFSVPSFLCKVSKLAWLGFMPALTALPVNNPMDIMLLDKSFEIMPGREVADLPISDYVQFRAGFVGNYVFNRHLEEATLGLTKQVQQTSLMTNGGFFAFDLFDHLTLYARLGATSLYILSNASAFDQQGDARNGKFIEFYFGTAFSWNVGVNILFVFVLHMCSLREVTQFNSHKQLLRIYMKRRK